MTNLEVFDEFVVNGYNMSDPSIKLKYDHSHRVAEAAEIIGKSVGLDEKLSYDIGLLHDYARFEQWKRFASYKDMLTIDHGDLAETMLFDEGGIKAFDIDSKDYDVVRLAVKFHNKKYIDYDEIDRLYNEKGCYLDKQTFIKYCLLARDADKQDLFIRIIDCNLKMGYSGEGYTMECLQALKNHSIVDTKHTNTVLDRLFVFIGFLYDINFSVTYSLFSLDDYFDSILNKYGSQLNESDRALLIDVIDDFKNYYENMLREGK